MTDKAKPSKVKFPCGICKKAVAVNHKALECDLCSSWIHIKCQHLNAKDYKQHQDNPSLEFVCLPCKSDIVPFTDLNNNQFDVLLDKGINYHDDENINFAPSGDQKILFEQLNIAIKSSMIEIESNSDHDSIEAPTLDCRYYNIDEFRKEKFKQEKTFSVFHMNIHSIDLHIEELRTALQLLDFKFDFICISESKILEDQPQTKVDISLNGYQAPLSTPTEATKGGVLLYARIGLNIVPRTDLSDNIYKSKEIESLFVEVINPKESNSIVGTLYRHPSMEERIFTEKYLTFLKEVRKKEHAKKFYIAGDFNFDLLKTSTHGETSDFFDAMMSCYLLPTITLPTKINSKNNTVIDNIFTSQFHPDMKSGNLLIGISDHLPSFLIVPKNNQNHLPKKHNVYKRVTKNIDKENFVLDYLDIDWSESLETNKEDINHSSGIFLSKINTLLDKYVPLQKLSQKEYKQRFKPWINDTILNKISTKNKILKRYVNCKDADRKSLLLDQFKNLKNEITNMTRIGKKDFYEKYFTENKNNLKKIWKGIKDIINIKAKNFDQPTCILDGDKAETDPKNIANTFNKYFTSIADNILKKRKYEGKKSFKDYLPEPLPNSMALYLCDEEEIRLILSSIDLGKSYGPNSIPTEILHLLKEEITKPLSLLFNLSFSTGQFPDMLKIAKTIPIFKKGSRLLVCNYRPISLLSNINKILEKLMYSRLYNFLTENNVFYELQFGFRAKHSTNHALIDIVEKIRHALDNKEYVCGIFVDLQKAFDTVNHSILLHKLSSYGVRGTAHDWIKSYLSNRSQFVSILGYESKTLPQPHGVPQGSVLGPLLFLIYLNDLNKAIKHSRVYHFADDTNLLNVSSSPKQMQKRINLDLKQLYHWLLANKISLNCSKTELIIFQRPGGDPHNFKYKIKMNGHKLHPCDFIKYLGVYLDSTLSGKYHCQTLQPKLNRACGMLSKARHYVPEKELISLYYAIFSSHMNYGCQIWGQNMHPQFAKIITLQKRAMRIIKFADSEAHSDPLFKEMNVLRIQDLIKLQNCLFVHDFLNKKLPVCFDNYFETISDMHSKRTINSTLGCLFIPHFNTTKHGLKSLTRKCIDNWNSFSNLFKKNLKDIPRFELKKIISDHFINSY